MANFQRTKFHAYVKLGARQKSMKKYRRATGRHNKTRQKWRSRPPMVEIGYKNKKETRGLIESKIPVLVHNISDLKKISKENIAIIGKVGQKNKIEIAKEAVNRKIDVYNLNLKKFLKEAKKKEKTEKKDENKSGKPAEVKKA